MKKSFLSKQSPQFRSYSLSAVHVLPSLKLTDDHAIRWAAPSGYFFLYLFPGFLLLAAVASWPVAGRASAASGAGAGRSGV
jgi:hypothetical protein